MLQKKKKVTYEYTSSTGDKFNDKESAFCCELAAYIREAGNQINGGFGSTTYQLVNLLSTDPETTAHLLHRILGTQPMLAQAMLMHNKVELSRKYGQMNTYEAEANGVLDELHRLYQEGM